MKKLRFFIERYDRGDKQTLGRLFVLDQNNASQYACQTLELPWKNNKRRVSCIPEGTYQVEKHTSPRFGLCFWIKDVPGRSEILIHGGNFYTDILGCILPGKDLGDLNNDGLLDVKSSKAALADLLGLMPSKFELEIKNV